MLPIFILTSIRDEIKIEENDKIHYWLIEEYEWDAISPCARVTYCNQMIHFVDGSHLPCIAQGESYGVRKNAPIYSNIYKNNNLNCWKLLKLIKPQRRFKYQA